VLSVIICFTFVLTGFGIFTRHLASYLPVSALDFITYFSFSRHFEALQRGVIDSRGVSFFLSVILAGIAATMVVLEHRKHE
jgi:ABC-2 type transport system permease protein